MRRQGLIGTAVLTLLVAGTGYGAVKDARSSEEGAAARSSLTIIAPAAAGGGWDLGSREFQQAVRTDSLVNNTQVVNVPGAGGTIGLGQLIGMDGDPGKLMFIGGTMIGAIEMGGGSSTLDDVTPIARLTEDYLVVAVPDHSEWETLEDFVEAWKDDPNLPIGGGAAGSPDHLISGQLARAVGIDASDLHYTPHSGGGELTLSLLSSANGTVPIGISGYNDFRDLIDGGRLRPLAVVAPERLDVLDAPTMAELGYEGVDIVNWRGVVAPPGITTEQRDQLLEITEEMVETESWQSAVDRNRWEPAWAGPEEFEEYIAEERDRVRDLMTELGII